MKASLLVTCLLAATPALAQTVTSLLPARNALSAPRTATVSATLSGPAAPATTLKVFSSLVGGQKAGTVTRAGNTVSFAPATAFKAGETLTAVLTGGGVVPQVWQFTAAAMGPGTFGGGFDNPFWAYPFGTTLLSIATVDLSNDGNLDVAIGEIGTNPSFVALGNGTGRVPGLLYPSPLGASYTQRVFPPFGDIDGDADLDVGFGRNNGMGGFVASPQPSFPSGSEFGGIFTDADADGDLDYLYTGGSYLHMLANNGTGVFSVGAPAPPLVRNGLLSTGDLDNDGDMDLVCLSEHNNGWLQILMNNGRGGFTVSSSFAASLAQMLAVTSNAAVGDVDADGDLDLLLAYQLTQPPNFSLGARVLVNNGQGQFTPGPTLNSSGRTVVLGDVDGDGDLDALTSGGTGLFRNDSRGVFTQDAAFPALSAGGGALLADMNNDGALDVLAAQPGYTPAQPSTAVPGILAVRLNGLMTATRASGTIGVEAWPNPVGHGGKLQLRTMAATPAAATAVVLSTLAGAQVRSNAFNGQVGELPTAGLAPGVYLLTVQTAGQAPQTRRIVLE